MAGFFGKTSKVSLTVNASPFTTLPGLPRLCRPVLSFALMGAVLVAAGDATAEPPAAVESVYGRGTIGPGKGADDAAGQAERIVSASLAGLARAESIAARLRQRVRIGDRVVTGGGRYVQLGTGEDQRFRLESSLKCDTEEFDLLEVCDGVHGWTYRRLGPNPPQLERIDIRRVRDRLEELQVVDRAGVAPYVGGIQRSLALLREWFRFHTVESATIDDVPVWRIEGTWNPDSLAFLLPHHADAIRESGGLPARTIPDGMPASIRLSIGKRELFPFRIEWLAIPGKRPVAEAPVQPIAVMELYDVRIAEPVDASAFVYRPATEGMIDITDGFVAQVVPLRP